MSDQHPVSAGDSPAVLKLESGDHWWCACGRSANQPFCDGSHKGTGLAPLQFSVEEPRIAALCSCKRTGNPPYCDGSHSKPTADA